jgi:hypothetical protein
MEPKQRTQPQLVINYRHTFPENKPQEQEPQLRSHCDIWQKRSGSCPC